MARRKRPELTEAIIRQQLSEVVALLAVVDAQRDAYVQLIRGYEEWLRVYADRGSEPAPAPEQR